MTEFIPSVIFRVTKGKSGKRLDAVRDFVNSKGIYDCKSNYSITDDEDAMTIEGTVGVPSGFSGAVSVNNVYRRPDGSVYMTPHDSAAIWIDAENESGGSLTKTMAQNVEYKSSGGNKTKEVAKEEVTFTVNLEIVDFLESAAIKEMSRNDSLVKTTQIDINNVKEKFVLDKSTAYVIVEEVCQDRNDEIQMKRFLYDCEKIVSDNDEDLVSHDFYCTDDEGKIVIRNLSFIR